MAISKGTLDKVRKYKNLKAKEAEIKAELATLKEEIVADFGGDMFKTTVKIGGIAVQVSYQNVTSTSVDADKVKKSFPDWKDRFSKTITSPRFIVK